MWKESVFTERLEMLPFLGVFLVLFSFICFLSFFLSSVWWAHGFGFWFWLLVLGGFLWNQETGEFQRREKDEKKEWEKKGRGGAAGVVREKFMCYLYEILTHSFNHSFITVPVSDSVFFFSLFFFLYFSYLFFSFPLLHSRKEMGSCLVLEKWFIFLINSPKYSLNF